MMIGLKGDNKWKVMRTLASPVFTSGKLKAMVPLIDKVSVISSMHGFILFDYWYSLGWR